MPRVKVADASSAAKANPREYAILRSIKADERDVSAEEFEEYSKRLGGKAPASDVSFEEFVALFSKPGLVVDGEGNALGYAARDPSGVVSPYRFNRRDVGPNDVRIQITHAGICHSDLHQVKNEWFNSTYPMVPGHEIVGIVTEVGADVSKFKVGDRAGVGCMVNSCGQCHACTVLKEEQYCKGPASFTYNGVDKDGTTTQGGYSTFIVVDTNFALKVPDNLPLDGAAPLLCAGITVYSPIRHFGLDKPGMHVGVVGLGGLGHMAVKFLKALRVTVTVISTSPSKREEAIKVLGADHFLVSKDEEAMKAADSTLDGLVNTVSATLDLAPLLALLKLDGKMVCVGAPSTPPNLPVFTLLFKRLTVAGSLIGGIAQTQEMLDFCGQHNITCMIETIPASYINEAYERMAKADVRYRFVIDVAGSLVQ